LGRQKSRRIRWPTPTQRRRRDSDGRQTQCGSLERGSRDGKSVRRERDSHLGRATRPASRLRSRSGLSRADRGRVKAGRQSPREQRVVRPYLLREPHVTWICASVTVPSAQRIATCDGDIKSPGQRRLLEAMILRSDHYQDASSSTFGRPDHAANFIASLQTPGIRRGSRTISVSSHRVPVRQCGLLALRV
jgi:hypothetical protein